jgi:hypothetical protein
MSFQDTWTRWHHKLVQPDQWYPSNNPWIYTAECMSVGLDAKWEAMMIAFQNSRTQYGFHRHPDKVSPAISHDEIIGLIFVLSQFGFGMKATRNVLVRQWEKQRWQICDLDGFEPKSWMDLNWFGVIYDFYQIYKLGVLYEKTGGKEGIQNRHATPKFPRVHPIAFHMGGWKRYLIKRHAGLTPTLWEKFSFLTSKLWTVYGSKDLDSGKRILGFQLRMLQNKTYIERIVDKAYNSRYNLKEVAAQEYAANHPILERL